MSFTLSSNMQLPIPGVGTEAGPQYATDVNNSLTLIDQHDHTPGKGVPISPSGLNINTALTFNNNFATDVGGVTLVDQVSSVPADATVYRSGDNLWYVDGVGNNVQLTQNGAVAGTPGSIANLTSPASASYISASSTFVFESDVNTAGNIDGASFVLRNISPNSTNSLTLSPPAALSSSYDITLPSLPSVQSIMTLDSSGNMTAPYTVDGSTVVITANRIAVGTVTNANLAASSVDNAQIASTVHGLSVGSNVVQFLGNASWTCPVGVTRVYIQAVAGGGGGGGSNSASGGAGGCGSSDTYNWVTVAPGTVYPVVIGTGGAGGNNGSGGNGADTTFNGVRMARGGFGGVFNSASLNQRVLNHTQGGLSTQFGEFTELYDGGVSPSPGGGAAGGGGGAGGGGPGPQGGGNTGFNGVSAAANSGAGGGGAGAGVVGGNGGSGYMYLFY